MVSPPKPATPPGIATADAIPTRDQRNFNKAKRPLQNLAGSTRVTGLAPVSANRRHRAELMPARRSFRCFVHDVPVESRWGRRPPGVPIRRVPSDGVRVLLSVSRRAKR
jgi:hypothetical protein